MNKIKKGIIFMMLLALLQGNTLEAGAAAKQYRINVEVCVDGVESGSLAAFDENYDNNLFISLKGFARLLESTDKAFVPIIEKRKINILTEWDSTDQISGNLLQPGSWDEEELSQTGNAILTANELLVNGEARRYYSFIISRGEEYDAFLAPISLAMLFDLDIKVTEDRIEICTTGHYSVSPEEMEASGYLQGVNALLIGDASTGQIFYGYETDEVFPIASTTKLMTYLVFMDAVSQGKCSLDDVVVISEEVSKLSNSPDGVIPMLPGGRVPVKELLYGMLLPSSNECALALAEHAAGTEEAFVEQMNAKAQELGWTDAEFYNSHGLPSFEDQLIPAKVQNHMTAAEMFELAAVILDTYPQITEITSTQKYNMPSFGMELKNTNGVLYNLKNVIGLKTGTTNKAGACLVTCAAAEKGGETHNLITVLLGAEGDLNRGTISEMAVRYAITALEESSAPYQESLPEEQGIPDDPEAVVRKLTGMLVNSPEP